MRIAVCGKGGSGKSMISGALARQLAQRGHQVIAVDADPNPNLGISLGVDREVVEHMKPILNALIDAGHTHNDPKPLAEDLLARYGVDAPEGIRLVATGKIERPSNACLRCGPHHPTRQFFGELADEDRAVVADLEAGLNDLIWAKPGANDVVLAVSEGSEKSVEIARRAVVVAQELGVTRIIGVANRTMTPEGFAKVAEALGVEEMFSVPEDPAVEHADHLGQAPMDVDPTSAAMVAVSELADLIFKQ